MAELELVSVLNGKAVVDDNLLPDAVPPEVEVEHSYLNITVNYIITRSY